MTVRLQRGDLERRLSAVEARMASSVPNNVAADAASFVASIKRLAERYSPEAAETPLRAREKLFSPAQRLAWAMRFGSADEFTECLDDAVARVTR